MRRREFIAGLGSVAAGGAGAAGGGDASDRVPQPGLTRKSHSFGGREAASEEYVFVSEGGGPMTRDGFNKLLKAAADHAGIAKRGRGELTAAVRPLPSTWVPSARSAGQK